MISYTEAYNQAITEGVKPECSRATQIWFESLKKEYPTVKFIAYHVTEKGQTRQIEGYNLAGFSGSTAVIGDDNWISPVGSVKKFQLNSKNTEQY